MPAHAPDAPHALPVVVLTGPTAAGKSALALDLAERLGAEIVNADSMQVYRFMDIGTAKPSLAERARVPHHLIDVVTPDVQYSAGRFAVEATAAVRDIRGRGRHAFLVGGTGLYVRAFLEGLSGVGSDPTLRRRLEEEDARARAAGDPGRLHLRLAKIDPERAATLHPHDARRVLRALEIHEMTGRLPSDLQREAPPAPRWRALYLVLDPGREALRGRIDARCRAMVERGLLQEVRALRERGYGPELPSMQAIGYRHMQPVVEGRDTLASALERMQHDTRQFARRQRTWLRGVRQAVWMHPDDAGAVEDAVAAFLEAGEGEGEGADDEAARPREDARPRSRSATAR